MLPTSALDYDLPEDLIARRPAAGKRDESRLMVVWRSDSSRVEHRRFRDLPEYLRADDLMVFNTSRVVPARFLGVREDTGGKVEGLFLRADHSRPDAWEVMLQTGGVLRPGVRIRLLGHDKAPSTFALTLDRRHDEAWRADLREGPDNERCAKQAWDVLGRVGLTPLPPYIRSARARAGEHVSDRDDRAWYQAVYASPSAKGSVAAPTAGLHFTPEVLSAIGRAGVNRAEVVLHVGAGTFKPVQTERVEDHPMHAEAFIVPSPAIRALAHARKAGGRIIPVGTTSVRAIESLPAEVDQRTRDMGWAAETRLLITPGFAFRWTDGLVTNFHLPRSTLLALAAAMLPEGVPRLLDLYRLAVRERYRFYSYGDAMLILP